MENLPECSRFSIFNDGAMNANVRRPLDAESIFVSGGPYSAAKVSSRLYHDI